MGFDFRKILNKNRKNMQLWIILGYIVLILSISVIPMIQFMILCDRAMGHLGTGDITTLTEEAMGHGIELPPEIAYLLLVVILFSSAVLMTGTGSLAITSIILGMIVLYMNRKFFDLEKLIKSRKRKKGVDRK